ncbi:MAG TPA: response regulator [Thermoanaerobaculia bacterium]|nr:response regulator [Thermoanaerobaculia bacterium]
MNQHSTHSTPSPAHAIPAEAERRDQAAPLPPRRILVVDDNLDAAEGLAMLLSLRGHQVATAYDGPSAIEQARKLRPDVVLLDIGLPRLDGFEVARRLREEHTERPLLLVALTGYGQERDRVRAREAGFDHHLLKPVRLEMLEGLLLTANASA